MSDKVEISRHLPAGRGGWCGRMLCTSKAVCSDDWQQENPNEGVCMSALTRWPGRLTRTNTVNAKGGL